MSLRADVDRQYAHILNNVGRDQYHLQQTIQLARASFLQQVAAAKTKASHLVLLGFLMLSVGSAVFMYSILTAIRDFNNIDMSDPEVFQNPDVFPGPEFQGFPIGLIGFGAAFIGQFILMIGAVLHIVTTARRRYVEDRFVDLLHVAAAMPNQHR